MFNRCGFELKNLPLAFSAYAEGSMGLQGCKRVKTWLSDISTRSWLSDGLDGHLRLIGEAQETFHMVRLSVHFAKYKWCAPHVEFIGMAMNRRGRRPLQSKVHVVVQLSRATTIEQARSLLGTTGYLRKFEPECITLVAPISELLRD